MLWFLISALLILIDQLTKLWVLASPVLMNGGRITIIDGFFHIIYTLNRGAALSFLADRSWGIYVLTAISFLVGITVAVLLWRQRSGMKLFAMTLSLILAGTVGNLIDRVRLGGVVDFLDFQFGSWHFPTFNVADSCLTIGAFLLIILFMTHGDRIEHELQKPGVAFTGSSPVVSGETVDTHDDV